MLNFPRKAGGQCPAEADRIKINTIFSCIGDRETSLNRIGGGEPAFLDPRTGGRSR
ncbi:hypothetical protein [Phormidium sp. CCY1219]|uniref:hypothetical protein n=1 Tax=Phormidium sp. CCY1219 TaxID=2886104 RepID=UPI002D1EC465|nr:hypothetical protein [Phormidium sp. CCY1219]MEB3827708.1 hypothetical protein [Phormidium sp. CCY1219]